jgi:ketosteroid isomerase-like protein
MTTEARDRTEVLAHIDGIFRAYIERDRERIRATHTPDWIGFQGPSVGIERGIDAYMVNADQSLASLRGIHHEIVDHEVRLHGDLALVYYVARYACEDRDGTRHDLPLRSLDVYRREDGSWIQCGSHIAVIAGTPSWLPEA